MNYDKGLMDGWNGDEDEITKMNNTIREIIFNVQEDEFDSENIEINEE